MNTEHTNQSGWAAPVPHSPIDLQSIPDRQRSFTADNIRDIAHDCIRIGDNDQAEVVFAIADALRDGNLIIKQQTKAVTTDAAVAAIQFALETVDAGLPFLKLWNEGEFDLLRREWPEAPEAIYIGADLLLGVSAQQPSQQQAERECGCGWRGRMEDCLQLGAVGPLCPACRETTEQAVSGPDDAFKDAERYKLLRLGRYWSVIGAAGQELHGDDLDVAVDGIMRSSAPS